MLLTPQGPFHLAHYHGDSPSVPRPELDYWRSAIGEVVRSGVPWQMSDIRQTGRNAQGVKLIELAEGDKLQGIARVASEKQEEDADTETGG